MQQRLPHILTIEVWIVRPDLFDGSTCTDLTDDHAYDYAHAANARLTAHPK
jgi:hypothetical protein